MAFNMSRWRVQANNLYLPYQDLDAAGSVGRLLTIPDDVGLVLAYAVNQTPTGFSTQKSDKYGVLNVGTTAPAYTVGYSLVQALTGNQSLTVTLPARFITFNAFTTASLVRITFTQYETGLPFISQFASASPSTVSVSAQTITILNTTATATTLTLNAFNL